MQKTLAVLSIFLILAFLVCEAESPLFQAVLKGDLPQVRLLLSQGADAYVRDEFGNTLLHKAAQHNHVEIIKLLFMRDRLSICS